MTFIAWDIETCPRPYETFSDAHRRRHKKEYEYILRNEDDITAPEAKRKASSTHPLLGWICCISMVAGTENSEGDPQSWTAAAQDEEEALLQDFWTFVGDLSVGRSGPMRWVTFDGKRFDVPFLTARTLKHGVEPTRSDLLRTHKYRQQPHADLANLMPTTFYSLVDLCDHLGVDSPKQDFDGADVAPAVADGRIDEVRQYCERDVLATLRCAQQAAPML